MIEELLKKPEQYRIEGNYRATHLVFPVEFEGCKYVVKKPRTSMISSVIRTYYSLQGEGGNKNSVKAGLLREIKLLQKLKGFHAPRICAFDPKIPIMVREYPEGRDFRNLTSEQDVKITLEGALESLQAIHNKDTIIGDTHIKNTFLAEGGKVYWVDFDGNFDESDVARAKAQDLLKFIYSTYTATRDRNKTLYAADLVARNYQEDEVKKNLQELINSLEPGFKLWFSTRLPLDGKLHQEIKTILSK